MQLAEPLLELLELFLVFVIGDGHRQVHVRKRRHFPEREFLFKGFSHIPAFLQHIFNAFHQELQDIADCHLSPAAVQDMPRDDIVRLLHEVVIGIQEAVIFPVLPEILIRHAPFRFHIRGQALQTLILFLFVDMDKDLQEQIASVAELALKLIDRAHTPLEFLFGDFPVQIFADDILHPAGIHEQDFSVFRDRRGIRVQERITGFLFGHNHRGDDIVKARVQFADQLLDQTALSGGCPALNENQDRDLFVPQLLGQRRKTLFELLDVRF